MKRRSILIRPGSALRAAAVVLVAPAVAAAQMAAPAERSDRGAVPEVRAVRVEPVIVLDGRLDEAAWAAAEPVTELTQIEPAEGAPASEPTEIRVLYDDEALYVGARLHQHGSDVASRLGRRDAFFVDSDWFSVALDSYHNHLTAFEFSINPAGVKRDQVAITGRGGDDSWDPVWDAATSVDEEGWTVELRIPFSQLRFSPNAAVWGVQFSRRIMSTRERSVFSFTPKRERGGVARYGHLVGLEGIEPARTLEILPYAVGRAAYRQAEPGDPFSDGADYVGGLGVDLKYGLTSNLTLDATINPDFGQVEVDPAVVNLSAYETHFREKRPFFVEGADIFGGGADLFYSRRIGRRPQGDLPDDAVYHDVPEATTILGAAKVTGRTANGWSIGLLEAVTGREEADFVDALGERDRVPVEPLTSYFVGRLRRDFRSGGTVAGVKATAVNRRLETAALASRLRASAYAAGLDFTHEWADRAWSIEGHLAFSRIAGRPEVLVDAQTSSARYFQRPDADHLALDSTATMLSGFSARLELAKRAGLHWRGKTSFRTTSPGYETNDLGYQRNADRHEADFEINYVEDRPGAVFRDWRVSLRGGGNWNHGGDFVGGRVTLGARGALLSYWGGNIDYTRSLAALDDRLTRGGPLARKVAENELSFRMSSDFRRPVTLRLGGNYAWDDAGGFRRRLDLNLGIRPADNWSIQVGPEVNLRRRPAQYVATIEDATADATFGRRYIFAELAQTTVSMEARVNVTFTPDLTLELFAQPYISSGDYGDPKQLRAPRTFEFDRYGVDVGTLAREADGGATIDPDGTGPAGSFALDNGDFNFRSLRGNAVLRWEWRPGSTLYLVWQQVRSDEAAVGDFDFDRDRAALFRAPAENILQVKVDYWLSS